MNCSGRTNLEQELEAFFTARQQSCGKVMFPVVSVCQQGWAPVQGPDPGYSIQGQGPHPHYRTQPWHPLYRTLAQPPLQTCSNMFKLDLNVQGPPDLFKLVQLGIHCTGTPFPNKFRRIPYEEMPSCVANIW